MSNPPVILPKPVMGTVEVVRSFSYKLNVGNYESRDFFCSQKAECSADDAERISELLYQFCKRAVLNSVREYQRQGDTPQVGSKAAQNAVADTKIKRMNAGEKYGDMTGVLSDSIRQAREEKEKS